MAAGLCLISLGRLLLGSIDTDFENGLMGDVALLGEPMCEYGTC